MKRISDGAEAIIYREDNTIIKDRISKGYRHPKIDESLRKSRTRTESKILTKIGPKLISTDKTSKIEMKYVKGDKVRDILDKQPMLAKQIGEAVAQMHDKDIVHGDLTTSNMIQSDKTTKTQNKVELIDFGLSYFSKKIEDKAVDIHLFKQALESKHYKVYEKAYEHFLKGYAHSDKASEVLKRLRAVEKRGRYKTK